ncbi:MAG TPA: glycine--tRNA ligase subunit beta [Casimicrobiaceae bacterium]|jgi:glycyl-tRNA synthetase beta chain
MAESLLVEIVTEELPPKALKALGEVFADRILNGLVKANLKLRDTRGVVTFATPRRIAVLVPDVLSTARDRTERIKLMPAKVAFDTDGKPSPALLKRLDKEPGGSSVLVTHVQRALEGNVDYAFVELTIAGATLVQGLQAALDDAISKLPIPKMMSYQRPDGTTVKFVRPAHRLVALHGAEVVPVSALGLEAGRITAGHRFLGRSEISVATAEAWEPTLEAEGKVIPSFTKRQKRVEAGLARLEQELSREIHRRADGTLPVAHGDIRINVALPAEANPGHMFPATTDLLAIERALSFGGGMDLLEEVTALVEWPFAYWGKFDKEFLEVPIECLALTMKQNQKYFPVFDSRAQLLPYFAVMSNMELEDASNIVTGNERVIRPRLSDARFFYFTDKKTRLQDRVGSLATVIFHSRLGSQLLRVERIRVLARSIARRLNSNVELADRTALLCKADLSSAMVTEFPELQGVMGRYYAIADGESEIVANAIEQHYWPRFADDHLPEGSTASAVAIADRLDSLVGLFGVGERPTGDKDRYGLRRQALAVLRTAYESRLPLDLHELLKEAKDGFALDAPYRQDAQASQEHRQALTGQEGSVLTTKPCLTEGTCTDVYEFMLERLRNWLRDKGHHQAAIEAILSLRPGRMDDLEERLRAVEAFSALPEAEALAAANKRIGNILRKNESEVAPAVDRALLVDGAERDLYAAVQELLPVVRDHVKRGDYTAALRSLASARTCVDRFFDDVLVMADDSALRANRLALLRGLSEAMNQVADISKLAA